MTLSVSVVIVNYNGWALLRECLASLRLGERQADEMVVVDNGSTDGSPQNLRREFPWVTPIDAGSNLGFAAGNNLGIARARGDVIVLLNNDALAEPAFLGALVAPLEREQAIASVAGTLVFASDPGVVASAGIDVFDTGLALDRGLGGSTSALRDGARVFGASAGAAAYRRRALEQVGGFPESFFMYLEDVDLAWRLRLAGWEAVHASGAVARHVYSASAGEASALKRRLLARNRIWVIARCMPGPLVRRNWWRIVRFDAMAMGYATFRRDSAALAGRVEAVLGLLPRLRERAQIQSPVTTGAPEMAYWLRPSLPAREVLRLRRLTARLAGRDDRGRCPAGGFDGTGMS